MDTTVLMNFIIGPIRRYKAIILDEYADLGPKEQEMGRMLRALLDSKLLQANTKLVVTSAALDQDEINRLIGSNPQGSPDDRT